MKSFKKTGGRTTVLITDSSSKEVAGYEELVFEQQQAGGKIKNVTLKRVALLPGTGCKLLSAKIVYESSDKDTIMNRDLACIGTGAEALRLRTLKARVWVCS